MASIKVARTQLRNAGLSLSWAQEFTDKLNSAFGNGWCSHGNAGIGNGGTLLLPVSNIRAFLVQGNAAPSVIALPSVSNVVAVNVEVADYYENDNGTFQCNYCDHKPYKRERDCIRHLQTKHVDKVED